MVYYVTGSGLNAYLWSISFGPNTIDSLLRVMGQKSYFGDNGLGELFLDLPLPVILCPYCGVDLEKNSHKNFQCTRKDGTDI